MYPAGAKRTVHVSWSSHTAFVLAGAGAAVGLNNFWQFPSLVFTYGGSAFLIVYAFCLVLLGAPLLGAQFMIGRLGRNAPDGAFHRVAVQARAGNTWWVIGAMAIVGGFVIFCSLSVISGWTLAFVVRATTGQLTGLTADGVGSVFTQLVLDSEKQVFWYSVFIVSIAFVSARGLRAGPEPVIRYAVPIMFGLMSLLLLYVVGSSGFSHAALDMLTPDFTKMSWTGVFAAAAHAFFSLSLGTGTMFMIGAYLERNAPLARLTWYVVGLDTLAGLLAALTVYTALYTSGVKPVEGLALLFQALPLAFDHFPLGRLCLVVFFTVLIIAAWISGLALFEPAVMWVVERFHWTRPRAALACGIVAWVVASVNALSFNAWSFSFSFFDKIKEFGLFDVIQIFINQALLPVVGIVTALFAGWVLRPELAHEELDMRSPCAFDAWLWLMRLAIPVVLMCVMFQLSKL